MRRRIDAGVAQLDFRSVEQAGDALFTDPVNRRHLGSRMHWKNNGWPFLPDRLLDAVDHDRLQLDRWR